jgi:hypothetical protein
MISGETDHSLSLEARVVSLKRPREHGHVAVAVAVGSPAGHHGSSSCSRNHKDQSNHPLSTLPCGHSKQAESTTSAQDNEIFETNNDDNKQASLQQQNIQNESSFAASGTQGTSPTLKNDNNHARDSGQDDTDSSTRMDDVHENLDPVNKRWRGKSLPSSFGSMG